MMVLVIGGSGSGKSSYAEDVALSLSRKKGVKRYYLATMRVGDEEGRRKVKKHRELRYGKGFLTVEQPTDIHEALAKTEPGEKALLLECVSNLAANEMFREKAGSGMQAAEKIVEGIAMLKKQAAHLVVVSNNVFEDGACYEEATMEYIRAVGWINRKLAKMADQVVEVAAGIPVAIKR